MSSTRDYDAELHMFREPPRSVDLARLRFVRWLAEHGRLEHYPAGAPSGPFSGAWWEPPPRDDDAAPAA
jgi:hypothetical protein